MLIYKKSITALLLVTLMLSILLSGCGTKTPPAEEDLGVTDETNTAAPSIETEIVGTWQITAIYVHGDSRQDYASEVYLTFASDGTVELSDTNHEEPLVYSGTYYAEDDRIYTNYTTVNQESYEVSPENMNGEITIDGDTGELVYDYFNDSNGLTWYFVKK